MARPKITPKQPLPESRANPPKAIHTPVTISFRHVEPGDKFCLSQCKQDDVREVCDCLRQLTTKTWFDVMKSGGKPGHKVGLGYTPYDDGAFWATYADTSTVLPKPNTACGRW